MLEAIENMRNSGRILREINNTFITLIPQKDKIEELDYFRPISLCNAVYKVLSKAIANRIKKFMSFILSQEQTCCAPRRSIPDGVIIAREALHSAQHNLEYSMLGDQKRE